MVFVVARSYRVLPSLGGLVFLVVVSQDTFILYWGSFSLV